MFFPCWVAWLDPWAQGDEDPGAGWVGRLGGQGGVSFGTWATNGTTKGVIGFWCLDVQWIFFVDLFFNGCSGYYNLLTIFSGSQTIEVNHVRYTFCISAIPSCGRRFLARDEPRRRRVTSWHPEISWWSSRWGPVMRWCDGCCPRSQWDDVYCELPWWMG